MAFLAQKFLPNAQVLAFDTFSGMPTTDKSIDLHNAGDFREVDLAELRQYAEYILVCEICTLCKVNLKILPHTR